MREFDHNGLLLAEYQGKLFEKSADLNCSSPVFIRRFLHSDLLKVLDENNTNRYSIMCQAAYGRSVSSPKYDDLAGINAKY